jgi:adenylate cyclase
MGIHLGDVVVEGERIFGNGVNAAARLHALADPGGLCISDAVRREAAGKLGLELDDLGPRELKNLGEPLHAFRVRTGASTPPRRGARLPARRALLAAAAGLALVAAALYASWPHPLGLLLDLSGFARPLVNPPLPDQPSLAVLPFQNMSNDPDQEYFSDGIAEDLTTDLSRLRGIFVISRQSAFSYKGKPIRVEQVGRELGVRYVVEGSVRKAKGQVRVTAQLIDATTGHHVWSRRYDRELADVFALQSELVDGIVTSLSIEIREAEQQRVRRKRPGDVSAYDAHLRGTAAYRLITRAGNAEARKWFERALEIDPDYSEATAMLASTYMTQFLNLWSQDPALLVRARELGRRALELDPENPVAYQALGLTALSAGEPEEALRLHEQAVELDPSYFAAYLGLSLDLLRLGRGREGLAAAQKALRLDPLAIATRVILATAQLAVGRTEEAEVLLQRARTENPDAIAPRLMLAGICVRQERMDEARALVAEMQAVNPELSAEAAALVIPVDRREGAIDDLRRAGLP